MIGWIMALFHRRKVDNSMPVAHKEVASMELPEINDAVTRSPERAQAEHEHLERVTQESERRLAVVRAQIGAMTRR